MYETQRAQRYLATLTGEDYMRLMGKNSSLRENSHFDVHRQDWWLCLKRIKFYNVQLEIFFTLKEEKQVFK